MYIISLQTRRFLFTNTKIRMKIFYCIKGSGFGVLEDGEIELSVGQAFIAPARTLHSLRSDGDLYVTAFLVPVVDK